jgi:hypothetical protein
MQKFENLQMIEQAKLQENIKMAVTRSMQNMLDVHGDRYNASNDGCVIVFDQTTTDEHAQNLFGHTWSDAPIEAVTFDRKTKTFLAVIILNNQLAHVCIIPDMPWIPKTFRAYLIENLCGEGPL